MQTILLISSSRFLFNDLDQLFGRPMRELRIAHVINASKGKGVGSLEYLERTSKILKEKCLYAEDLDLDGKNEEELREILNDFDGVFVNGGSTFYLLKSMRESGFDNVIKELVPQGFIYMGASAGSYVACPTIEMATWKHQNKYDNYGMTDFTALGLVPFLVTVHYGPEYKEILEEKIPQASLPVRILDDRQAILVRGEEAELLGGEEIKL